MQEIIYEKFRQIPTRGRGKTNNLGDGDNQTSITIHKSGRKTVNNRPDHDSHQIILSRVLKMYVRVMGDLCSPSVKDLIKQINQVVSIVKKKRPQDALGNYCNCPL